ncbi:hypothetical protein [Leucobacter sp. NPDC077196]|uniref:protease inhibitor I42 family protein n=1 Tax=Leucobacter sp. NPDC077196 TaxID=3154959 RepID=UPI003439D084
MRSRALPVLSLAAAALGAFALSGCAAPGSVTVGYEESSVAVENGTELTVDFGEVNMSVGSDWVIISDPDPSVLSTGEKVTEYAGESDSVGGPNDLAYRFTATGTGQTKIQFEYQFRGAVPDDPTEQKTALIDVTVE